MFVLELQSGSHSLLAADTGPPLALPWKRVLSNEACSDMPIALQLLLGLYKQKPVFWISCGVGVFSILVMSAFIACYVSAGNAHQLNCIPKYALLVVGYVFRSIQCLVMLVVLIFLVCLQNSPDLHILKPALYTKCLQLIYIICQDPLTAEPIANLFVPGRFAEQLLPHIGSLLGQPLPTADAGTAVAAAAGGHSQLANDVHVMVAALRQRAFTLKLYSQMLLQCQQGEFLEQLLSALLIRDDGDEAFGGWGGAGAGGLGFRPGMDGLVPTLLQLLPAVCKDDPQDGSLSEISMQVSICRAWFCDKCMHLQRCNCSAYSQWAENNINEVRTMPTWVVNRHNQFHRPEKLKITRHLFRSTLVYPTLWCAVLQSRQFLPLHSIALLYQFSDASLSMACLLVLHTHSCAC